MKTNKFLFVLSTCASVFFFSCKKEKDTSGITYQLKTTTTSSLITARVMSGNLQWTSGYASAAEIEFEAESKSVEIEHKSETKQKIDLFSPLSSLGGKNDEVDPFVPEQIDPSEMGSGEVQRKRVVSQSKIAV